MNKVLFLLFCHLVMVQLCCSGSSGTSDSGLDNSGADRSKGKLGKGKLGKGKLGKGKGKWAKGKKSKGNVGLSHRVDALEDETEDILKDMAENEKVVKELKNTIEILQRAVEARNAAVAELKLQINGNMACCQDVKQAFASLSQPTTTTKIKPTTTEALSTLPPSTTTTTEQSTTTKMLITSPPTTPASTRKPLTPGIRCTWPIKTNCELDEQKWFFDVGHWACTKRCPDFDNHGFETESDCSLTCEGC